MTTTLEMKTVTVAQDLAKALDEHLTSVPSQTPAKAAAKYKKVLQSLKAFKSLTSVLNRNTDQYKEEKEVFVVKAKEVALALSRANPEGITSKDVFDELVHQGFDFGTIDKKLMGGVFQRGRYWTQRGFRSTGSHGRPQAMWSHKEVM